MDIATIWNETAVAGDYRIQGGSLVADAGLKTAVLISLFSDRRAATDDVLPTQGAGRRGWWGDVYLERPLGSRLWLLAREKESDETLLRAREYAIEALAWLVEDGIAQSVDARASVPARGVLLLQVEIRKPQGDVITFRFQSLWDALLTQGIAEAATLAGASGFIYNGTAAYDGRHDYSGDV